MFDLDQQITCCFLFLHVSIILMKVKFYLRYQTVNLYSLLILMLQSNLFFPEKRDYFATSILAESTNLQFDSEGRISLSSKLLKHAKIKNSMLFVGQGQTFQIWEPAAFEKFKTLARKKANLNRASLKWEKHLNNNEGK